uniref:Uncharacterized protein n=1 Tax=Cacopsylla melanoneura TaxID=428564 RepID=A0A8D9ANS0_9HEMI
MYNEAHGIKKDKIEARNVNSDTNKSEDGNFVICTEKEGNSDQQTEVSSGETVDTSNDVDTAFAFDGKEESDVLSTPNNDTANDKDDEETNSEESGILMANSETKIDLNLVRTFSDNILKSLLAHIRISQISMMDLNIACELDMFEKYKTYFRTNSVFSQTLTPRCEHTCGPCVDISKPFKDLFVTSDLKRQNIYSLSEISKTYTVSIQNGCHFNQSKEEYSILKDLKLQLIVLRDISQVVNTANLKVSLYCNPNSRQTKYECTGKCQVTLLSQSFQYPNIVLHRPVTFTPNNSIEKFQFTWNWDDRQAYYISVNKLCKSVAIEVEFKSLEIKLT